MVMLSYAPLTNANSNIMWQPKKATITKWCQILSLEKNIFLVSTLFLIFYDTYNNVRLKENEITWNIKRKIEQKFGSLAAELDLWWQWYFTDQGM